MRFRRSTTEVELRELETRRTKLAAEIEQAEATLEQAASGVTSATRHAAMQHLDGGDVAAAAKARQEAETQRNTIAASLEVLQEALVEQERRLAAKRAALHAEQLSASKAELERALELCTEASEAFVAPIAEADAKRRVLVERREAVVALRAKVAELGGDHFEHAADEAEWPDVRELVEFLTTSKAMRPLAERERAARKQELDAENEIRRERIRVLDETRRFATQSWSRPGEQEMMVERFFAQCVPAELRDEARALYETTRDELLSRPRARV